MKKNLIILFLVTAVFAIEAQNNFPNTGSATIQGINVAYDARNVNHAVVSRMEVASDASGQMWLKNSNGQVRVYLKSNTTLPSSIVGDLVLGEWALQSKNMKFYVNGNSQFNGAVGIGTANILDPTYKLYVKDGIRTEKVKIDVASQNGWADYVFEKDYPLETLENVEKYIKDNGHLKDIPSADEVVKNGIELAEMNKLLLQKIEELTLYTIQLKKEVENLKSKIK